MEISEAVKIVEDNFGPLSYGKNVTNCKFTSYTAKINEPFWDEIKNICNKNHIKLVDFIRNAFILYYLQLNGNLSEDERKKFLNQSIDNASDRFSVIEDKFEEVKLSVSNNIDELKNDILKLKTQNDVLINLLGGKLTPASAE